ncbi:MAG: hypothetical protein ABIK18_05650 [candidate division WOR-3 bacterium]
MRRSFLALFVSLGILLSLSCSRENTLQIVSVNDGKAIFSDLTDFGLYRDPTDPEAEPMFFTAIQEDVIPIELCYREIGLGLPTWRPYVAHINKVRVTFTGVMGDFPDELPSVETRVNILVPSDPSGKKTVKSYITLLPAYWKGEVFGSTAAEPIDLEPIALLKAKVTLQGVDEVTGQDISAETEVLVSVGEFWDDESRIGQ